MKIYLAVISLFWLHGTVAGTGTAPGAVISSVVTTLKGMLKDIESTSEADELLYQKWMCWCELTGNKMTADIAAKGALIKSLTISIAKLVDEIAEKEWIKNAKMNLKAKYEAEHRVRKEAFDKIQSAFEFEYKQLVKILGAIVKALQVLKPVSYSSGLTDVAGMNDNSIPIPGSTTDETTYQRPTAYTYAMPTLSFFLQVHQSRLPEDIPDARNAADTFNELQTPQAGYVYGVLFQMKEGVSEKIKTMKTDVETRKKYLALKLKILQDNIDKLAGEIAKLIAEIEQLNLTLDAQKEQKAETLDAMGNDQKFLIHAQQDCNMTIYDYEVLERFRQEEIAVIVQIIDMLENAGSFEFWNSSSYHPNTAGVGFLQMESAASTSHTSQLEHASNLLQGLAKSHHRRFYQALNFKLYEKVSALDYDEDIKKIIGYLSAMSEKLQKKQDAASAEQARCNSEKGTAEGAKDAAYEVMEEKKGDMEDAKGDMGTANSAIVDMMSTYDADFGSNSSALDHEYEKKAAAEDLLANTTLAIKTLDIVQRILKSYYDTRSKEEERKNAWRELNNTENMTASSMDTTGTISPPKIGTFASQYGSWSGDGGVNTKIAGLVTNFELSKTAITNSIEDINNKIQDFIDDMAAANKTLRAAKNAQKETIAQATVELSYATSEFNEAKTTYTDKKSELAYWTEMCDTDHQGIIDGLDAEIGSIRSAISELE